MDFQRCNTCAFFQPKEDDIDRLGKMDGVCHLHAPRVIVPEPGELFSPFPAVGWEHWCGDWKERPTPTVRGMGIVRAVLHEGATRFKMWKAKSRANNEKET